MRLTNSATGWGLVSRLLHWTMAALILFMVGLGLWMVEVLGTAPTDVETLLEKFRLTQLHKGWGVVVFGLAVLRLLWRLAQPARPAPPPDAPDWERWAAQVVHGLFYCLFFALPITGWLLASASPLQDRYGLPTSVFGWFVLPDPFVPGDEALTGGLRTLHLSLAIALLIALAAHVGGALRHHFLRRDAVLRRMIRGR